MKKLIVFALLFVPFATPLAPEPETAARERTAAQAEEDEALEEFVPSEKIPADSAISFPVDI
jgi:hypothetical protein